MEDILRFSALCIVIGLLAAIIGQGSRIMGMLVALSAGLVLFVILVEQIQVFLAYITSLFSAASINTGIFAPVFKVLGICLCGRMAVALCKDNGSQWAAVGLEILTVLSSLVCMLPLLQEVLHLVGSL